MQSGVIFLSISFALRLKCLAFYMPYLSVFKGQASNVCGSSKRMRARLNNKSNTIFVVVVVVVEFFLLILTSAVCVRVPLFLLYHSKFNTHFIWILIFLTKLCVKINNNNKNIHLFGFGFDHRFIELSADYIC